ncbi:MAG: SusD/RagB family nutrient-binding outer membrane lipoprotein [Prevotellaceae bacterium]|jgi:hypothetical protein|nr:SusD/RagB family nutrient-binding outer membrane lipoprotein [Prevotellaceae bacterium]
MIQNKTPKIFLALLVIVVAIQGCTGDFDKINRNPYEVTKEEMKRDGYNVGASLIGLQSMVVPLVVNYHQLQTGLVGMDFAGYVASEHDWTTKFSTYNPPASWNLVGFNDAISGTGEVAGIYPPYFEIQALTDDPVALALATLFKVAAMHQVTDTYGPVPYSQIGALGGLTAPYDSQEAVYSKMIEELNEIIGVLTPNRSLVAFNGKYDNVYFGVIEKWVKYANSLKLRMALRLSYVKPDLAQQIAESAVNHEIGVITSNADNAFLQNITQNPIQMQVIGYSDMDAGADIVSFMNGFNDPRRAVYFTESSNSGYVGLRGGTDYAQKICDDRSRNCVYSLPKVGVTDPLLWMNAAEVAFLKAEGALRGWNMGATAEDLYNEGITLSFQQHNLGGAANSYIASTATPAAYVDPQGITAHNFGPNSAVQIRWNDTGSFEENLERIITQKWIAIFPLGNEAWAEFRRTGYPKLAPVVLNKSGGAIPNGSFVKRLTFSSREYTENTENVRAAIQLLNGPDNMGTKLWWDRKN